MPMNWSGSPPWARGRWCLWYSITAGKDPVSLGLIELDEGAWLAARLIAGPPPSPGSRVNLQILKPDESEPIPAFAVVRGITACCPLSSA